MTAVHGRFELVDPLLLAHPLRSSAAFMAAGLTRCRREILDTLTRDHHLDDTAIAEGLEFSEEWNGADLDREDPLYKAILDDAGRWLILDGDHWSLRVAERKPGHEIVRWRGVTMLIPPSIVIAGALANHGISRPRRVQSLPASVAPQYAVGHLHVHLGPMLPFETLWAHLWTGFLEHGSLDDRRGRAGISAIKPPALPDLAPSGAWKQPGLGWQWALELALLARAWLERRLEGSPNDGAEVRALWRFAHGQVDVDDRRRTLLGLWARDSFASWAHQKVRSALRDRERHLRAESRRQDRSGPLGPRAHSSALLESDAEIDFIARALTQCEREHAVERSGMFGRLFYQYLRIKVALYGRLVVDPWTVGLRHFLDVVGRDTPYTQVSGNKNALSAARLAAARCEAPMEVAPLEIHTVPRSWLEDDPGRDRCASHAWILSFVRSPRPDREQSDGRDGASKWRRHSDEHGVLCRAIRRRLEARPSLLKNLRGVSLMDWERNGPVWLFEPHLRRLIDDSRRAAAEHPCLGVSPLRTAFHLGEDFDHVLSGLRQIYEPFAWELIGRGDRIGHALVSVRQPVP